MNREVIIVDDFYTDPDPVRSFALSQHFTVVGNYPGYRTPVHPGDVKPFFEKIIGTSIGWWPTEDKNYNGAFQYTTGEMDSWIHRDPTSWAALIYLTPNAPLDAGTAFFRHKETGLTRVKEGTPEAKLMNSDGNDFSKWDQIDYVANVYNRLVLFRGTRSHRSMTYFGKDKHTGRLMQTFFFNEQPPMQKVLLPVTGIRLQPASRDRPDLASRG